MRALDTNVLVRILTRDEPRQASAVDRLLQDAQQSGETFFISITVVLEIEWVLRSVFQIRRAPLVAALTALLNNASLVIEHEREVEAALDMVISLKADFADGLHISMAHAAAHGPLMTFDRRCARLTGAQALSM